MSLWTDRFIAAAWALQAMGLLCVFASVHRPALCLRMKDVHFETCRAHDLPMPLQALCREDCASIPCQGDLGMKVGGSTASGTCKASEHLRDQPAPSFPKASRLPTCDTALQKPPS